MKLCEEEVERLVTAHYEPLFRFALSLVGNRAEAADLTQQTYFTLAAKGGQIRDLANAKSWLYTTLYREFLALRKQRDRMARIDPEDASLEETTSVPAEAVRRAEAGMVMEALTQVRETFRVPLALFYLDDLSYKEIAEILSIPPGTVMSRLARGKAELRSRLAESLPREDESSNIIPWKKASPDA